MAKTNQQTSQQDDPVSAPSFDDKVKAALAGDTPAPATTQTAPQTPTPSDQPSPETPPPTPSSPTLSPVASSADASDPTREITLAEAAAHGRDFLHEQIRRQRAAAEAKKDAYTPPPATARQIAQREAEMAAGRKTVAKHEEQLANRPQVKPDAKTEGFNTPVSRPGSFVPDLNSRDPAL